MSLNGKFVMEKRENYEQFSAASGATAEQIERGQNATMTTEFTQDGDHFTVKRIYSNQTQTNTFTIGQSQDFTFADGKVAKAIATREGGKIVLRGDNFSQTSELDGGKLKETLEFKGEKMIRWSARA